MNIHTNDCCLGSPIYNTEICDYDGGDCCVGSCVSNQYTCGTNGYTCIDPQYA